MKKVFVLIVLLLFIGIGYGMYISLERSGKEPVRVFVLPQDAVVTVGEKTTKNNQTIYLEPGEYSLNAKRDGFSDYSDTVRIVSSKENIIDFALSPNSEEASNYVKENEGLYLAFEDRSGERAIQEGIRFSELNTITRDLPHKSLFFSIGYRLDPLDPKEESIIIEIDANEGYKNGAIQYIRNLGYNPTEYNINFRNHRNPFNE